MRPPRLALVSVVAAALVAPLPLAACSGDDDGKSGASRTTTTDVQADVTLRRGDVVVASAGPDVQLDETTQRAVVAVAQRYLDGAVLAPFLAGEVGRRYPQLFDTGVRAAAEGPDRAALTDGGVGRATRSPEVRVSPVRIDALAGPDGAIVYVAASFTVDITARTSAGRVGVHRSAELTMTPPDGERMLVTGYRVSVRRDLPGQRASTTTAARG
jgi:hypothetical protein